ncbi:MAG: ComEA family DNA-binding protein [Prevotella sp.]
MKFSDKFFYRKSDSRSLILLLFLAVSCIVAVWLCDENDENAERNNTETNAMKSEKISENSPFHRKKPGYYNVGETKTELFPFDPNTADSTALLRLGLQPWQVRSIYKYRAHGGAYRRAEDFARLPGLTVGHYKRLKPYIRISPDFLPASSLPEAAYDDRDTVRFPIKIKEGEYIVLNTADTTELKHVPGIGSGYARAIIAYGEKLGGYFRIEQLDEIADFPQEAKKYFVIRNPMTRRMNINKLSVSQLKRHPYINFHQAKAIDDYRRLHGPLESLQQLKLHRDFPAEAIERLEPYVEY